jgi:hypothetical protein
MTPTNVSAEPGKRLLSPPEDNHDRPQKRPLILPSGVAQEPIDDAYKSNYNIRSLAYSPGKLQRSSKVAEPQGNKIPAAVPWRQEIVDNQRRRTKTFIGYTKNITEAREADEAWRRAHVHGHQRVTSSPYEDDSFPDLNAQGTDPKYLMLCSQIFYAICDWDCISEWTQVVEPSKRDELLDEIYQSRVKAGHQGLKGASIEELRPSDERLAGLIPDADTQHLRLMGTHFPDDYVIEQMASNLLDAAIDAQQGKLNVQPYSTADQG